MGPVAADGPWRAGSQPVFGPWFAQFGGGSAAAGLPPSSGGPLSDLRSAGGLTARAPLGRRPGRRRPGSLRRSRFRIEVSEDRFEGYGMACAEAMAHGLPDRTIQTEVLSGWAAAAREIGALPQPEIVDWLERRRELIAAGRSSLRVGHVDLLARPTGTR